MKTLDKFILKSYLGPMLAAFLIVMFILMMNVLFRYIDDLVGKGLPISAIVELLFYMTSTMLPIGLPFSTLLAAIMAMGNMGNSYELIAMKAAGVSLLRIMRSLIIAAALLSVLGFFIVNNYVPFSVRKAGEVLYDITKQRHEIKFKDGVFFSGIDDLSIRVGKQDPNTKLLTDVLIYDTRNRTATSTTVADSGYINLVDNNKYMHIILYNGQNYEDRRDYNWYNQPELRHNTFAKQEMMMELEGYSFEKSGRNAFGDASEQKRMDELDNDIDSLTLLFDKSISKTKNDILGSYLYASDTSFFNNSDSIRAIKKVFTVTASSLDTLTSEQKEKIFKDATQRLEQMKFNFQVGHNNVLQSSVRLYRSMIDWHKKLTLPVSILIFFLIGAPLGAIIRKGGMGIPTVIAVLFFIFYYVISMTSEKLVRDGAVAPMLGVWFPTMILFPIAIILMWKAITDSKLMDVDAYYIVITRYWRKLTAKYPSLKKVEKIKLIRFKKKKRVKTTNNE